MKEFAAIDIGASNGRTILGRFDGEKLSLSEVNRFANGFVYMENAYYWDVLGLYGHILNGLKGYVKFGGKELSGIGIDTWGVDFGLIDCQGKLIGNPRAYRDARGMRGRKAFHARYGKRIAFELSGISNMDFNTLYQLYAMAREKDPQLAIADKLLLMPDLLGYMLCGEATTEYTNATTTQMIDAVTGNWSEEILRMAKVSKEMFTKIQMSAEKKGNLLPFIGRETGLAGLPGVYCVGSHDTASAVAAVPAKTQDYAFISSGTWSLMGLAAGRPVINDTVYAGGFSNEGAALGGVQLLKNIMGLWIIQNCKYEWDREGESSWDDVVAIAKAAPPFRSYIDVNAGEFYDGGNMTAKIRQFCLSTKQPVPETRGEIARTVYESLAMSYRETFEGLEKLKGDRIETLYIVGGGTKNRFLNRLAANAVGRELMAGPAEATAIGNLMMQMKACREISGMDEVRQVIRASFDVERYEPEEKSEWSEQYEKYKRIMQQRGNI